MKSYRLLPIVVLGGLAALGCQQRSREEQPVKTTSETTRKTDDSSTTVRTETTQLGENQESKTEAKTDTAQGDTKTTKNEIVGTVTAYRAGDSIEVMTGKKETRRFDLDDKDMVVNLDPSIRIGERVRLVEVKGDKGYHSISVRPAT